MSNMSRSRDSGQQEHMQEQEGYMQEETVAQNQGNRVHFQDQNYNDMSDHQPDDEVHDIVHDLYDQIPGSATMML